HRRSTVHRGIPAREIHLEQELVDRLVVAVQLAVEVTRIPIDQYPAEIEYDRLRLRVRGHQSARIAIVGSIRIARNAGANAAASATSSRNALAAPRTNGSRGPTPNSIALRLFPPNSASSTPIATPTAAIAIA